MPSQGIRYKRHIFNQSKAIGWECDKCEQVYATENGLRRHIKLNKDQSCGIAYFLKRRQMEKNLRIRRKLVFRKQKWKFAKMPKLSADEGPLGPLTTVEKRIILRIFDSNMELHNNNYTKVCSLAVPTQYIHIYISNPLHSG